MPRVAAMSDVAKFAGRLPAWAPPLLRRLALYGAAGFVVWAGAASYARLRCEAAQLETAQQGLSVTVGDLGGQSLAKGLRDSGSSQEEASAVLKSLKKAGAAERLRTGDTYLIVRAPAGDLRHLTITRGLERVVVTYKGGAYRAARSHIPIRLDKHTARGRISGSLWVSMQSQGIPADVIAGFADVFQWTVDFLTEPRDGDTFALSWTERISADGRVWGREIQGGVYDGEITERQAGVLFGGGYYDEKGNSLQRLFLRAPLNYRRISSGFSLHRRHPISRRVQPHLGIDYAAPAGTPVVSIGGGEVICLGYHGGFGRTVEIRHNATFLTQYGHLSGYAKGLRRGSRVRQGELIGYVGSSGLATGPHLDFRISQGGRWINFLRLKFPKDRSIPKAQQAAFAAARDRLLRSLDAGFLAAQARRP